MKTNIPRTSEHQANWDGHCFISACFAIPALIAALATAQAAPAFSNGGFESGLTGWTATGNASIKSAAPYIAAEGTRLLAFNSGNTTPNGVLSATFATTPGQLYRLGFGAGVLAYSPGIQRMEFAVSSSGPLVSKTISVAGQGGGKIQWTANIDFFTANSAATTLVFRDISQTTASIDLLLDNISFFPVAPKTLRVESVLYNGVPITISPAGLNGETGGQTNLTRSYAPGAAVDLTAPSAIVVPGAPYKAFTMRFQKWRMDGADRDANRSIRVMMDKDHVLEPVYVQGPPIITEQPGSLTVIVGQSASFHVGADPPDTHYGWSFNGRSINTSAAVYPTLTIARATAADQGVYQATVGDFSGTVTSNPASLTVLDSGFANGGFESSLSGWTTAGNVRVQPATPTPEGSRVAGFNAGNTAPNGVLTQTFATSPGINYLLTFQMGVLAYNTNEQSLYVDLTGGAPLGSHLFTLGGSGTGKTRWETYSLPFTADGTQTIVRFQDRSATTASIDLFLDDIRIEALPDSFTLIPAGSFMMGSPPDENGHAFNETLHEVRFTNPLLVEKTETTWAEWKPVRDHATGMGYNDIGPGRNGFAGDDYGTHPVTEVSWWDVLKWCNLRSEIEGLPPVYFTNPSFGAAGVLRDGTPTVFVNWNSIGYRLPTEAEWEYLCRAGTSTAFFNGPRAVYGLGGADATLDVSGWYTYTSGGNTQPVATKPANPWGIHDVHGNVWEWCWDYSSNDDYPAGPVTDPSGPATGDERLLRGGSFHMSSYWCRAAQRARHATDQRQWYLGFRIVRSVPQ